MSLFITSLNSGSNGNCYYIGNDEEAVLIDAGISCRETERRMARLGLTMTKVKAIFVSHEHTDHVAGIGTLARKYSLPVYMAPGMIRARVPGSDVPVLIPYNSYETIEVGKLAVTAFPKLHDACDPHSFVVDGNEVRIGIFTDLGRVCGNLAHYFSECHAAFLETNYDADMLERGRYPHFLKNRIRGGKGHLSNSEALELFLRHRPVHMSHLLLSHLSKDNNNPDMVHALFERHNRGTRVMVASRYEETPVLQVMPSECKPVYRSWPLPEEVQLSLF